MYGIRVKDNIIIFLQSIERVGFHYGILLVLVEDIDLAEIGISLIDIVNANQFILITDRKLLRGVRAVNDHSGPEDTVIEIITVLIFTVRDRRNELYALFVILCVDIEKNAVLPS